MSVNQTHPLDSVELPPQLPPLNDAMTEEQYAEVVSEEQRKVGWFKCGVRWLPSRINFPPEGDTSLPIALDPPQAAEAEAEAAAAAAEAAEAARLARLREEYIAAVPDEVKDQVSAAVAREVERLKKAMVRRGNVDRV